MKNIMLLLDTDKHSTPFDILMAHDAGFDSVVPYENVNPEDVQKIVQDAMFSRGVKGANFTTIFVGGNDVDRSKEILEIVKKSMVSPFEISVIEDPRGGHTTASALVAKIEEVMSVHNLGGLEGKKVAILAGTGQVGQLAAKICLSLGAEVVITSRKREKAEKIVNAIKEEVSGEISGLPGANPEEIYDAAKDADVVIATGTPGVMLASSELLQKLEKCKVVTDVNAVPPLGIEELGVQDDGREILPGIYGIGALAVGDLKYKTEIRVLMEARKAEKGFFDYKFAFRKAKQLMETKKSKLEVLDFNKLEGKKLTVVFLQKLKNPSQAELVYVTKLIKEYDPDFVTEELGDRTIEDFYEKDPYVNTIKDLGVIMYPVGISDYAQASIDAMIDEKKQLADRAAEAYAEMDNIKDETNAEYVKAYADSLQAEYEELKEHSEITVKNSWMVQGMLDCTKEVSKDELVCLFIGGISHWRGITELLRSMEVEVRESHLVAPVI